MKKNFTLKFPHIFFKYLPVMLFALVIFGKANAQGTLTTTYTVASGISSTSTGITFVLQNTNATSRVLTQIDQYWSTTLTTAGPATVKLWMTTTDLSGAGGGITTPTWNVVATNTVNVTATGVIPTFTGLSVVIPAGAQYRFAIESNNGVAYGAATSTPNNITADGVTLKTGNALIGGSNVGYAINPMPNLVNNPRFFAGKITWALETPCSGTFNPGATSSTLSPVCPLTQFKLSVANSATPGTTGLIYQWQSSTTGTAGSYANIPSATSSTYTVNNQTVSTYYQLVVTCSAGTPTTSTPLFVPMNTICYCPAGSTSTLFEKITNFKFANINRTSSSSAGYESFLTDTAFVIQNQTLPATTTFSPTYTTDQVLIWIDFNKNGSFNDPGELVYTSPTGTGPHTGNITIPLNAPLGSTRMRVRLHDTGGSTPNTTSCGNSDYGQVEDYTINISPCAPVVITAQPPATASVTCGGNTTIGFTASGSFPVYQWQYRTTSTSAWVNITNNATFSGSTTNTLSITNASPTLNNNQFRALYSGTCTSPDFTGLTTLTVNPIVAVVTPSSASICLGAIQQLTITNIASPIAGSVTANSTYITPIAIPDAGGASPFPVVDPTVLAGINTSIPITIPTGAIVTGVRVRMSGTHTYVGDLVMALKAPNGSIINLDYFLAATGGGASAAFTNTVISSNATASLSTGTAAGNYTGTFKADLIPAGGIGGFGNTPSGPTGFIPTSTSWSSLITPTTAANATGNWTLAIFDGGGGDAGALNNWSITIDYLLGSPATGIYSGPAGTIFTDAAATTAYTGTAINTVFVKPLAGGVNNYSVVVTDAACSSNALTIPVTVNQAVAGTATLPATTTVCEGSNVSFTLGGALTGPSTFIHQYQVSTNGGSTYTNITNGGVYSGATTSVLTLTNVPNSFNGYRFRDSISAAGNCGVSLVSNTSILTVNPKPVVTISVAPIRNLFPGLTTTLTAAVSSATGTISYQWFKNGAAVTGATSNTLKVGIDGLGTYTVRVTDANICASAAGASTPASIVLGDSANYTKLFIYPSPNNGKFQVRHFNDIINGGGYPGVINVYDLKGSRVFSKNYTIGGGYQAMEVDLGAYHGKGLYRVDLLTSSGERIKTGTVLIF